MNTFHLDDLVKKYTTNKLGLNNAIIKNIKRTVENKREEDAGLRVFYQGVELKKFYQIFGYAIQSDLSEEELAAMPQVKEHPLPQNGTLYEYKEGQGCWVEASGKTFEKSKDKCVGLTTIRVENQDGSYVAIIDPTISGLNRPVYYIASPVLEETGQVHNVLE